jgi:hypothetical protein
MTVGAVCDRARALIERPYTPYSTTGEDFQVLNLSVTV